MNEETKNKSEKDLQEKNVSVEECGSASKHNLAQTQAFAMEADIDADIYDLRVTGR